MSGSELEGLRKQLNVTVEEFVKKIGATLTSYSEFINYPTISGIPIAILHRIQGILLEEEQNNLKMYREYVNNQPMGPFRPGKILAHLKVVSDLKRNLKDTRDISPITLEWHLTNLCNHDCRFCTFRSSIRITDKKREVFPEDLVDGVLKDIIDMKIKGVVFSGGGEPTLYNFEVFRKILETLKANDIKVGIITNGSKLGDEKLCKAISQNCSWIRISVDAGSEELFKETHGKHVSFEVIKENVKNLVKIKSRLSSALRVGVSYLLTTKNYSDIIKSVAIFRGIEGLNYFQVKPIVISPKERLATENIFWDKKIFEQLMALPSFSRNEPPKFEVYTLGFKFVDMIDTRDKTLKDSYLKFKRCWGHPFYPTIGADANVYICCLTLEIDPLKYSYGEITPQRSFAELWRSEERHRKGSSINVAVCPSNCKLSETNKELEKLFSINYQDEMFLN